MDPTPHKHLGSPHLVSLLAKRLPPLPSKARFAPSLGWPAAPPLRFGCVNLISSSPDFFLSAGLFACGRESIIGGTKIQVEVSILLC